MARQSRKGVDVIARQQQDPRWLPYKAKLAELRVAKAPLLTDLEGVNAHVAGAVGIIEVSES